MPTVVFPRPPASGYGREHNELSGWPCLRPFHGGQRELRLERPVQLQIVFCQAQLLRHVSDGPHGCHGSPRLAALPPAHHPLRRVPVGAAASQPARQAHGAAGVVTETVRADLVGVTLGDRRSADHHLHLIADAGRLDRFDRGLHAGHGGREEGGHGDDFGMGVPDGSDELLRRHVDAQVDHLEAAALQHRGHQVLADVVQIAPDGANRHPADRLGAALGQPGPDELQGALHRAGRDQQLRHEVLVRLEPPPDFIHRRDHVLVQQRLRIDTLYQRLLDRRAGGLHIPVEDGIIKWL